MKNGLIAAIEKEPENPQLYFSLGVMYDQLEDFENARVTYIKSLEVDPSFFNSSFNLVCNVFCFFLFLFNVFWYICLFKLRGDNTKYR